MATKGKYVDGFVFVVPKKKVPAYKKMARMGAAAWKKFGALAYKECMGEDLKTKAYEGMPAPLSFIKLMKAKPSDTVWFSFITFKNKTHRNQVNKQVMAYFDKKFSKKQDFPDMPVDMKDMAYGGFSVAVD
jgi:uncharacterized protein YbaA (DUF1428 family)